MTSTSSDPMRRGGSSLSVVNAGRVAERIADALYKVPPIRMLSDKVDNLGETFGRSLVEWEAQKRLAWKGRGDLLVPVLPLSGGKRMDYDFWQKAIKHAIVREKALKIFQYLARLIAYLLKKHGNGDKGQEANAKHFKDLSKLLSSARRFFKFFRWIKHFDDYWEALDVGNAKLKLIYLTEFGLNVVSDVMEDIVSLNKLKIYTRIPMIDTIDKYANYFQLALAAVEIFVSSHKRKVLGEKQSKEVLVLNDDESRDKQLTKRQIANLEIMKYFCDLFKAFYDCELSFSSELHFCLAGLGAGALSTHKQMLKCVK